MSAAQRPDLNRPKPTSFVFKMSRVTGEDGFSYLEEFLFDYCENIYCNMPMRADLL
jgi:hypothetical protein